MAFKRNQRKVSIAGIDFSYIREGSGKTILVLGSAVYYSKAEYEKEAEDYWEKQASNERKRIFEENLEKLKMPTLVVHSRYDYGIPYTIWENLVSDLNNVTFELFSESSHSPQTEHPNNFDPILISWLADN